MEAPSNLGTWSTGSEIADDCSKYRPLVDHAVVSDDEGIPLFSSGARLCKYLKLNGCLGLVAHVMAEPEQRGNGVEQPAHTRRWDAVDRPCQLLFENGLLAGRQLGQRREVVRPGNVSSGELGERNAVRVLDCGIPRAVALVGDAQPG